MKVTRRLVGSPADAPEEIVEIRFWVKNNEITNGMKNPGMFGRDNVQKPDPDIWLVPSKPEEARAMLERVREERKRRAVAKEDRVWQQ